MATQRRWIGAALVLFVVAVAAILLMRRGSAEPPAAVAPALATTTSTAAPTAAPTATRALVMGPADYCRRQPAFAQRLGFSQRAALATSQQEPKGLAVIDFSADGKPTQIYQDPTWDDAGWLGYVTLDRDGNIYVFPAPRENLVDNPPEKANILYRVDSVSAQMSSVITLTAPGPPTPENPYGLLGTTLDCDTDSLYATTVAGSTRAKQAGEIVQIDLARLSAGAKFSGVDAFGLAIFTWPEGKRLYYGLARTADVYSIGLDGDGAFVGEPQYELSLLDPNFKAWRIRFEPDGVMQVRGLEFDFNLKATSQRQEVAYRFRRDLQSGVWNLLEGAP